MHENKLDLPYVESTISRLIKPNDVFNFWKGYIEMFPKIKEKTWTALELGLIQYLQVGGFYASFSTASLISQIS